MTYLSKMNADEWKYPHAEARRSGHLLVSQAPGHELYWAEYGHPEGEVVLFLHGGPGGATLPSYARFFDPARYRVVLFDQRGCGRSRPSASDPDGTPALGDNTTDDLIADMVRLREALAIDEKAHVFGGSWGSTLALAYAIAHPDTVQTLILRGIFLCRQKDLDYFYQGNAAGFADDPYDTRLPGTYMCFPEAWKQYVEVIAPEARHDMVKAYAALFSQTPQSAADEALQTRAAVAWSVWEGITSYLAQDTSQPDRFADPRFARAFARIENHYFMNGAFLGGRGEANRTQSYLLENVHRIRHIPVHIVHGRYDVVCPRFQADELVHALEQAGARAIDYRVTPAGHSMQERENQRALTDIMDSLPRMR